MRSLQIGDLTIPIPIVQGGMGIGISMSGLASAVARAGGIGVIASVGLGLIHGSEGKSYRQNNIDGLIGEIRKARQKTSGVLGVNIMSVLTNYGDLVETAISEKIDVIFSGAGLPLDLPKYKTPDSKTKLVPIVSSGRAAELIAKKWWQNYNYVPDAFVLEGPKAGGHLGFSFSDLENKTQTLEGLLPEVVKVAAELESNHNISVPIIAGGGITTGYQIAELLNLGASAVQIGTCFIATHECDANHAFKEAIVNAGEGNIKIIQSPVGLPGRAINNEFLLAASRGEKQPKNCKYNCIKSCDPKTTKYCITDALLAAYNGKFDSGFAFTGANFQGFFIDVFSYVG